MLFSSLFNFSHQRVKRWRPRTIVNSSKRLWQSTTTRYGALFMFLKLCFNVSAISGWIIGGLADSNTLEIGEPRKNQVGGGISASVMRLILWINYSRLSLGAFRDLFRKRSYRKSKRRACSPLGATTCLSGNTGPNTPGTPVGPVIDTNTPPTSIQSR